jgi:protein involved in polysaccharide export with SLBB domain
MTSSRRIRGRFRAAFHIVTAIALVGGGVHADAQRPATGVPPTAPVPSRASEASQPERTVSVETPDATRAELTELLDRAVRTSTDPSANAGQKSKAASDAAAIRSRLETGDFQPGDRFVMTFVADTVRRDTYTVREGQTVDMGTLPVFSTAGVLRSELQQALLQHLKRFYRNPEVRVETLTRVSVLGAVGRPGTYTVPPDLPLSELLAAAGGYANSANIDRVVVRRGSHELVDSKGVKRAVREGATISRLGIRSGDEVRVAERSRRNWGGNVTMLFFGLSAFTAVLALIRSSASD